MSNYSSHAWVITIAKNDNIAVCSNEPHSIIWTPSVMHIKIMLQLVMHTSCSMILIYMLHRWSSDNGMRFNATKSNIIIFGNSESSIHYDYFLGGVPVKQSKAIKYLGVYLTNNLKWDMHIEYTTHKAIKALRLIKYTLHDAPQKIKLLAYNTLCKPILK